jgi:hypothetical protein
MVVGEATPVNADVGLPSRKLLHIQFDFVGKEGVSRMRQGDDPTKTFGFGIVALLGESGFGTRAVCRDHGR